MNTSPPRVLALHLHQCLDGVLISLEDVLVLLLILVSEIGVLLIVLGHDLVDEVLNTACPASEDIVLASRGSVLDPGVSLGAGGVIFWVFAVLHVGKFEVVGSW